MGKLSGSENVSADSTPSSEIDSVFWSSVSSLGPAREQLGGVGNSVGGLGSTWENSVHGASGRALPQASAPGGGDPAQLALLGSDRERQLRSSGATTVQGLPAGSSPRGAAAAATEPVYMNSSSLVAIARREPGERIGLVQPLAPVTQASSEAKLSHLNKDVKDPHLAVALVTMPSTEPVARKRSNEAAIIGGGCAIVDSGMSTLTTAAVETELAGRVCTSSSSLSASVLPLPAALPDVITAPDPASSFARDHLTPSVRDPSLPSELPADPEPGSNGGSATAEPLVIDACVELSSPLLAVMHQKFGSSGGSIPSMADLTFYEQRSRSTSFASQASASSVSLSACSTSAASAEGVVEHDAPARPLFHLPAELPPAPVAAVAAVLRRRHAESAAVSASARHAAHGAELAAAVAAAAYHEPKAGSAAPEPDGIKAGIPAGRNSVSDGSESDYVCLPPTLTIGSTQSERTVFENGIRSAKPSVLTAVAARETGSGSMRVAACAVAAASSDLGDTRAGINSSTSASPPLPQLLPDVSAAGCESSARPSQASVLLRSNATVGGSRPDQSIQRSYTEVKAGAAGNSSGRPLSMHLLALDSNPSSPTLPRTGLHRQPTFTVPQSSSKSTSLSRQTERRTQSEVEFYTENYLNKHKKGLFGKTLPPEAMLSWTKESITKPMLRTDDKNVKKEALEVFRLIQCYMGDRKTKMAIAATALDVVARGWQAPFIRDEIYIQLCRQTTDNPKEESMLLGWELIAISLSFFPPSAQFCPLLEHHIYRHINEENSEGAQVTRLLQQVVPLVVPVSHYAQVCKRRLSRISAAGARKGLRKPTTEEVEQAKRSIINPSMFGETLEEIMTIQRERYPDRKLPWIQTTLSEEVLRLNGAQTEGIFRVPADIDEVNALKLRVDQWQAPAESSTDPHLPASLLKLWYRELYEPIIPNSMYESCMQHYSDSQQAINIVNALPEINRLVLSYLIRFLQVFAAPDNVAVTKMDVNNLAMVMAPNCLRCESDDPRIIFENTRKEMGFIRTLIRHMDTAYMQGVI